MGLSVHKPVIRANSLEEALEIAKKYNEVEVVKTKKVRSKKKSSLVQIGKIETVKDE